MAESKERFGRYLILDHLVNGGMAKICRARFLGEQADKVVAIKMIQPQYSSDESFKQMFMDEIKVTFGLLHPNIVQTYDYGIHKDQLFVAMEYCDGRNLKEYLDRLRQKKYVFPVEICVYIISQVCQGLNYSHNFTDKLTGKKANIIHRDISPHNIMLTYDGAVKIIDFGIAKANTNSEATQAGTIKGKLSYLAPEYLDGLNLDHRYDQFAVGITLWEMLCSRKLFKAANDLAVLKKIQECKIVPPSKINPHVPEELDEIVLRALRKDRNKRFENMDKFNRALIKFLYANYPDFNSSDLSYFARDLFKEEIKKDRERLFEFGKIDIKPFIEDYKAEQEGRPSESRASKDSGKEKKNAARKSEVVLDFGFEDQTSTKTSLKRDRVKPSAENKVEAVEEVAAEEIPDLRVAAPATKKRLSPQTSDIATPTPSNKTRTRSKKSKTRVSKTEKSAIHKIEKKGMGGIVKTGVLVAGLAAAFFVFKEKGFDLKSLLGERDPASVEEKKDTDITPVVNNDPVYDNETTVQMGPLYLEGYEKSVQRIYLDGKRKVVDALGRIKLELNRPYILRIERQGFKPIVKNITINDPTLTKFKLPVMKPESFGYLYTPEDCQMYGKLTFELYGEKRSEDVPIESSYGVPFPVYGDQPGDNRERGVPKTFTVFFKPEGFSERDKAQVIQFSFTEDEQRINICDLRPNY